MFHTALDDEHLEINTGSPVFNKVTSFEIHGSYLEIEGYITVKKHLSFQEDEIRKTLLLVPKLNIDELREKHVEYGELSDSEILDKYIIKIALDNCRLNELKGNVDTFASDELGALAGYKGSIDLSTLAHGKPLEKGEYNLFIKLEQLLHGRKKFERVLPLSSVKEFIEGSSILNTKLQYFSAKKVLKYNLIVSFDKYSKTLLFKNTLLQSYDPREQPSDIAYKESRKIQAIKRRLFKVFYMLFCMLFPIKKRKVVFASDSRSELNGNLYFVYEELYKRNLDLNITFIFNERINNKKTINDLVKTAYHFATAKIILLDDFYPLVYPLNIRNNADLIQVWHAAGAFKTFGYSRIGRPGGPSPKSKNHKNYTKALVSSEGVRENYAEGFGITVDKVYATGIPRADIFADEKYKSYVKSKLTDMYPFIKNKKVILFAPTFRGNGQASAHYPFEVLNLKQLYEELHEEYVFLFKIHPFVNNKLHIPYEYKDFFFDLSDYREVNDLLLITDILITDYSSVCFEYALLKKPMLFFAFDVEKYIEERDFYYNYFDFIPGPLVKTTAEMVSTIKEKKYDMGKIDAFVDYFFDSTVGKASKNVVDEVIIPSLEDMGQDVLEQDAILTPPSSRIELFERSIGNYEEKED
ncbi:MULTISPECIES: CDP-glycerol glycerophosphotransferase family protein [Clostridia]|uniref:CDP-glycerol glycerophosphotransferase family protein n=1 Tax=Clostridia TaxID=186801 RepID=UPI000EA1387E|nr:MULTISPECIES: CDP-glycerol glycerophosphotransferase family protein [Clostridia]NBJ68821.1 polyribitolphosphotransferase [Roseburia sp. 1XD42-34]RKI80200.1 polyribitolphosphotransferase [Clostridium sp. 1xD42-85]